MRQLFVGHDVGGGGDATSRATASAADTKLEQQYKASSPLQANGVNGVAH